MPKFGGGGNPCTVCSKTVYPAETVQFEKMPYHVDCFRCNECNKKMEGASNASLFEGTVYCKHCFQKGGFAQKQRNVKWEKSGDSNAATSSKFGGGGNPCTICEKTVYPAETVQFEKRVYHGECFACNHCSKKMTPSGAAQFEGTIFCTKCFKDEGYSQKQAASAKEGGGKTTGNYSSKFGGGGNPCTVCTKTVYPAETLQFEKKVYHSDCFACTTCQKKCTPSGAAQFEDAVYCTKCFKEGGFTQKQAASAKTGGGGATGSYSSKFGGGGNSCYRCEKTVYPAETVSFEKKAFHSDCFTCLNCDVKLSTSSAEGKKDGDKVDIYCKKCWGELGLNRAQVNA